MCYLSTVQEEHNWNGVIGCTIEIHLTGDEIITFGPGIWKDQKIENLISDLSCYTSLIPMHFFVSVREVKSVTRSKVVGRADLEKLRKYQVY